MYNRLAEKRGSIAVIGLGYVGLPLALELARNFKVIGFDINNKNIELLQQKVDPSQELAKEAFDGTDITFTSDALLSRQTSSHSLRRSTWRAAYPP